MRIFCVYPVGWWISAANGNFCHIFWVTQVSWKKWNEMWLYITKEGPVYQRKCWEILVANFFQSATISSLRVFVSCFNRLFDITVSIASEYKWFLKVKCLHHPSTFTRVDSVSISMAVSAFPEHTRCSTSTQQRLWWVNVKPKQVKFILFFTN